MTDEKTTPTPLARQQRKLLDAAAAIWSEAANPKDAAFLARELVQCSLPHKNPGDLPAWTRRNGRAALTIQPGWNPEENQSYGYPYGTIPRLLLFWMTSEAIRTKSRRLQLSNSLSGFIAELGLSSYTGRGKRSDAKRLREQMQRLFRARFSFTASVDDGRCKGEYRRDMLVAEASDLWWDPKQPAGGVLWGSWVELGQKFFDAITAAPVPVDMRALQALKKSPLALDLYAWLVYEAFRAHKSEKSRFETWEQLRAHLGGEYADLDNFRKKLKPALAKIRVVYPGLKLGRRQGGIEVLPESFPALAPRTIDGECTTL